MLVACLLNLISKRVKRTEVSTSGSSGPVSAAGAPPPKPNEDILNFDRSAVTGRLLFSPREKMRFGTLGDDQLRGGDEKERLRSG